MAKYTPGPWRMFKQKNGKPEYSTTWHLDSKTRGHMAILTVWDVGGKHASANDLAEYKETMAEVNANAKLISAAPELLEALKVLVANYTGDRKKLTQALAAIRKAERTVIK